MATITIKNVPDELYTALKRRAAENRRSINNEIIMLIERAFEQPLYPPDIVSERVRLLREQVNIYVTEEEVNAAKNEGRP